MAETAVSGGGRRGNTWRLLFWGGAALLLLAPAVAMQFTDGVAWTASDFIFAGALMAGAGLTFELAVLRTASRFYRGGVGLALAAAFLLIWLTGAVGIIGSEDAPANRMYFGVIGIALAGGLAARFRAAGLSRAMTAAALAQAAAGALALAAGWGATDPSWPWDIAVLTVGFSAIWGASAWLFARAAHGGPSR